MVKNCPSCGERVGRDWSYCAYCGYVLPRESPRLFSNDFFKELKSLLGGLGLTTKSEPKKKRFTIKIKTSPSGPNLKFESGRGISKNRGRRFLKMPENPLEPKTEVKQFLNELKIKAELPGVKGVGDLSITRVGESIEIRAVASKDKGYFKVIHVPREFMLEEKKFNKGLLELKFRV